MSDFTDEYEANQHIEWLETNNAIDRATLIDWYLAVENESRLIARLAEARGHVEEITVKWLYNKMAWSECFHCGASHIAGNTKHNKGCAYKDALDWLEAQDGD